MQGSALIVFLACLCGLVSAQCPTYSSVPRAAAVSVGGTVTLNFHMASTASVTACANGDSGTLSATTLTGPGTITFTAAAATSLGSLSLQFTDSVFSGCASSPVTVPVYVNPATPADGLKLGKDCATTVTTSHNAGTAPTVAHLYLHQIHPTCPPGSTLSGVFCGAIPTPPSSTQWRITVLSVYNAGAQVQTTELWFVDPAMNPVNRGLVSGVTVTPTLTAGTNNYLYDNNFDGGTSVANCDPLPCVVTYTLSSPVSVAGFQWGDHDYNRGVKEVNIQYHDGSTFVDAFPNLQVPIDPTAPTSVAEQALGYCPPGGTTFLPLSLCAPFATHTLWRISIESVQGGGNQVQLTEIGLMDGTSTFLTPLSTDARLPVMTDGVHNINPWNCDPLPCNYHYAYASATLPQKLRLSIYDDVNRAPQNVKIHHSTDGSVWTLYSDYVLSSPPTYTAMTYDVPNTR